MIPKQYITSFICLLIFSVSAIAQPPEMALNERMEALKVSFITKKLQLNTEEAKVFWPVYNEYDQEAGELRKQRRSLMQQLQQEQHSENETNSNVEAMMKLKVSEAELDQKYYEAFKEVIGVEKAAEFFKAKEEFKRILLRQHAGKEGPGNGGPPK